MIHPLKAASSYDCDGCGHHASFHRMESKEDEEVARRWRDEGVGVGPGGVRVLNGVRNGCLGIEGLVDGGMRKRRRIADRTGEVVEVDGEEGESRDLTGMRNAFPSVEDLVNKALSKKRRIADETDEVMEVEFLGLRAEERAAVGRRKRKGRGA